MLRMQKFWLSPKNVRRWQLLMMRWLRKTAKVYGIEYVGTPYILVRAVFEGFLSKEEAKGAVNDMVSAGWRCSVESYAKIMELLERV